LGQGSYVNHLVIETIDRTLRDICDQKNMPFGGKLIAFGDNFKQILLVVTKGSKQT